MNGYDRRYNISYSYLPFIKQEINYINYLVEFERAYNGQDDELEDDA